MIRFPRAVMTVAAVAALSLGACKKQADAGGSSTGSVASGPAVPAPAGGWTEQVSVTPDGGYRMGNPDAPVKLIEYGSRTCPHCGHLAQAGMPDIKRWVGTGKLSYEFRDFAIHPMDVAAILLGRCNGPASFFPILEGMFADQENTLPKLEKLPDGFEQQMQGKTVNQQAAIWADYLGYKTFVGQRGVPSAKADQCLADSKAVDKIGTDLQAEQAAGIDSTPSFILNGDKLGSLDWEALKAKLTPLLGS